MTKKRLFQRADEILDSKAADGRELYWRLHDLSKSIEGGGFIDADEDPTVYGTILDAMKFVQSRM